MRFLKRAKQPVKYTFTISIREIMIEGSSRWQPRNLSVKLRRRKRHYSTESKSWEPTLRNPYRGITFWPQEVSVQFDVTLYKNSIDAFEEKIWKLIILDHEHNGKTRRIATRKLDLSIHTTCKHNSERLPLLSLEPAIESTISFSIDAKPAIKSSDTHIQTNKAESIPQICQAKQNDSKLYDETNQIQDGNDNHSNTDLITNIDNCLSNDGNLCLIENKHSEEVIGENDRTANLVPHPSLKVDDNKNDNLESQKIEDTENLNEIQSVLNKSPEVVTSVIDDVSTPHEETPEEARARQLREKARELIASARKGELVKPSRLSVSAHSTPLKVNKVFSSISSFETARQNSIEIYDYPTSNDEESEDRLDIAFRRNSIATRSARMRRFKFYQFRRIHDDTQATENFFKSPSSCQSTSNTVTSTSNNNNNQDRGINNGSINSFRYNDQIRSLDRFESCDSEQSILVPREDVIQGKIPIGRRRSSCVGDELKNLEEEQRMIEEKTASLKNQFMKLTQRKDEQAENGNIPTNISLSDRLADLGINIEAHAISEVETSSDIDSAEQQKRLLKELCELVNKKNDVIRRQMQLNILEKEATLERTFEQLDKELRSIMLIEESKKTEIQKQREKYLLDELVALVEKRNELVHDLDAQEKAIEEDNNLKENLRHVKLGDVGDDQNCCIQ